METTKNIGLRKPGENDTSAIDDLNYNADEIDKQITGCLGEIEKVKKEVAGIDVTTDVEEVVNRRLNPDISKSLSGVIGELITTAKNVITNLIDTQHSTTRTNITTHNNTKAIEINNYTLSRTNEIKTAINTKPSGIVKSVQRGVVDTGDYIGPNNKHGTENRVDYRDVAISSINPSKSVVVCQHSNGSGATHQYHPNCKIVNATTIRVYASVQTTAGSGFMNINWQVVEYY